MQRVLSSRLAGYHNKGRQPRSKALNSKSEKRGHSYGNWGGLGTQGDTGLRETCKNGLGSTGLQVDESAISTSTHSCCRGFEKYCFSGASGAHALINPDPGRR